MTTGYDKYWEELVAKGKNGCHNHEPYAVGYYALDRHYFADGRFEVRNVLIKRTSTDKCQYDKASVDKSCEGCSHFDKAAALHCQ